MRFLNKKILLFALLCCILNSTFAISKTIMPKQNGSDRRFRTWTYHKDRVYYFPGYYLNPTYIEFENNESVKTISTPKPTAWQFVPSDNRLFLKPIEDDADTTATVMTDKRTYYFELHAKESTGPFDANVPFSIKFKYPENQQQNKEKEDDDMAVYEYSTSALPDLSKPELFNFQYTISGDEVISPVAVFDDGKFTYLKFKDVVPAVFAVDDDGYEGVVNFRIIGDYMIIERISGIFTLRNGAATVCVFNEFLLSQKEIKKTKKL